MADTLLFGWQDRKFVIMVMNGQDIKHRISMNMEEATDVRSQLTYGREGITKRIEGHVQIDTKMDDRETFEM